MRNSIHDRSVSQNPIKQPGCTIGVFYGLRKLLRRATGCPIETDLSEYWETVEKVKAIDLSNRTDQELADRSREIIRCCRESASNQEVDHRSEPGCLSFDSIAGAEYWDDKPNIVDSGTGPWLPYPEVEIETFALACEASRRTVGLDPFDVQLVAGLAMSRGRLVELPTGEGKTLAAVFPACLHALTGRGVHVLTFNDYLARRDAAWMGPIYSLLGLKVGCVQEGMSPAQKRAAYACDVTYATAKEAGFDLLRDQIAYDRDELVYRPFYFALVDEADSILIDEARIPLVISGAENRASWDSHRLASLVRDLMPGRDFDTDEEHRNVFLTDAGIERAESILRCGSLYSAENHSLLEALYCALHAEALLRRDIDYIVRGGRIEIVDEFTGRVVDKRHWPDGLQAAVEAKERLTQKIQGRVLGSITLQHFFRVYPRLSGMTATAESAAHELHEFYGLKVTIVPPHTPSVRVDHPDRIFIHREAKRRALIKEIRDVHTTGRPVLVGTLSVRESEELAAELRAAGVKCRVLNAKNDELEAGIIARAGRLGAVTISTNMAGRGTDIKLGGLDEYEAVAALGGLYVIGTNRHESLRIDRQLRGRSGRQGDPGATRFFISLEDDLFERYGLTKTILKRHRLQPQDEEVPFGAIHREIEHAQRIIEGQNFDIRRMLYKYSSLVELQRRIIQARRESLFLGNGTPDALSGDESNMSSGPPDRDVTAPPEPTCEEGNADGFDHDEGTSRVVDIYPGSILSGRKPALFEEGVHRFGPARLAEIERSAALYHVDRLWSEHLAWIQDTRDSIHLVNLGGRVPIQEFRKWATDEFVEMYSRIDQAVLEEMAALIREEGPVESRIERLKGPSSTWTYLVNDDQFGWGIDVARNVGFAATAAFQWPLLILALMAKRLSKVRKE